MDGHAAGAPDDPGRHQPGPQPGEGGRPDGRDDGVQWTVGHVGGGQRLGEHLPQGLGVPAGISLLGLGQHSQGASAGG